MSELVLRGGMILVGGSIVLAGTVIAAEIMGYSVPFGGPLLLICAALIIAGVFIVNRSAVATASGDS
ncbi:hypothetical protein L1S32_00345 [Methanogenium sp. S4BF]|uniref:hypothetical protein n=1 Tax=Methanogenium sp. S4BF TaxID=1789226 RepID=UPI0024180C1D|nr:hypothetical protein [Methanogenium sp. S4BF]WFN34606.1 hypothetical protein L1S32_00345 [Methanogenium sp. S4BF]